MSARIAACAVVDAAGALAAWERDDTGDTEGDQVVVELDA